MGVAKKSMVVEVVVFSVDEVLGFLNAAVAEAWSISLGNKRGEGRYVEVAVVVVEVDLVVVTV